MDQRPATLAAPAGGFKFRNDDYWYAHEGLMTPHWPERYEARQTIKNRPITLNNRMMAQSMRNTMSEGFLRTTGGAAAASGGQSMLPIAMLPNIQRVNSSNGFKDTRSYQSSVGPSASEVGFMPAVKEVARPGSREHPFYARRVLAAKDSKPKKEWKWACPSI